MQNYEPQPGATPPAFRQEHPSTYFVSDQSNQEELTRLTIQDHLLTSVMGGVLAEQPDPQTFRRVLDVGCSTGSWLIELARLSPSIPTLVGVDISSKMLDYARVQATEQQVGDRVEFHVMDALRMLEFPTGFFDLVNLRLGVGFLRKWDWPKLIEEFKRISINGGIIRITEGDIAPQNNSPALTRLFDLQIEALYNAGNLFEAGQRGIIDDLWNLLERAGLEQLQMRSWTGEYQAGSLLAQHVIEDMQRLFRTMIPFLRKWTRVPENYNELYQQMLDEINRPDFTTEGRLITVWGKAPK